MTLWQEMEINSVLEILQKETDRNVQKEKKRRLKDVRTSQRHVKRICNNKRDYFLLFFQLESVLIVMSCSFEVHWNHQLFIVGLIQDQEPLCREYAERIRFPAFYEAANGTVMSNSAL